MNRAGLVPVQSNVRMPSVYRLWRLCQDNNTLWWSGGMAAQPRILMMEFEVCNKANEEFTDYARDIQRLVKQSEAHLEKALSKGQRSGYPGR